MHTIAIEQPLHTRARWFREICVNYKAFSKRKTKICEINTKQTEVKFCLRQRLLKKYGFSF